MIAEVAKLVRLESLIAGLLHYGTGLATIVIGVGLGLALAGGGSGERAAATLPGMHVITSGIAVLILLPILRVILMLIVFVWERDHRFIAITAAVLMIIILGFVLGMRMAKAPARANTDSPRRPGLTELR